MATYSTNQLKNGLKVILDGEPFVVLGTEFVKPGKGQAFYKVKLRNLVTGRVWDRTYRSGFTLEGADIVEFEMEFLYTDGTDWHFMRTDDTYEQVAVSASAIGETKQWLTEQDRCTITLWDGQPISVDPPNFVDLEVSDTDAGVRGDTVSGGTKPATLSTGVTVRVPLFIDVGEMIRIDTRTSEYVSRSKA